MNSSATPEEDTDELERKVYIFGERVEMENLITLDAELHVRLFQSSVIKDTNMGEAYLALRDDFSGIVDAQRGVPPKSKVCSLGLCLCLRLMGLLVYIDGVLCDVECCIR